MHGKGHFEGGHMPANCNVSVHYAGDKRAMRPFAKLLWTLVSIY